MNLGSITTGHARGRPTATAIVDVGEDRILTWAELDERVCRLATALLGLGLQQGDRVGVLSRNTHRLLELYLAIAKAGLVITPLNVRLVPSEIALLATDSEMRALVVDAAFWDNAVGAGLDGLDVVIGMGEGHGAPRDYERVVASGAHEAHPVPITGDLHFTLGYTSGTTGLPKGAVITQHSHVLASLSAASSWRVSPEHRNMLCLPLYLAGGWNGSAAYSLVLGATSYVMDFGPNVLEVVERERIQHLPLVPTMVGMLLNEPNVKDLDLSSLKTVLYAGSPMPSELLPRAIDVFGERFVSPYGMTESCCTGTVLSPEDIRLDASGRPDRRARSAGRPMPLIDVRLLDEEDQDVPRDGETPGEIMLRGDTLLREYWRRPEATEEAFFDGWFRTGDVGVIDADGYVTIVDRKKDMIISGGANVASVEVESALYGHPGVQLAAAIGVPDERWIEAVAAYVVPAPGQTVTEEELRRVAAASLADYKRPKHYHIVDALPMTALGKIAKRELRAQHRRVGS